MSDKVDQRRMRQVNREVVVEQLRGGGRLSRAELATATSLTKATVSAIASELFEQGVIRNVGLGQATSRGGRRPALIEFNPSSAAYVGVHFGGGHTRVAVADGTGALLALQSSPSVHADPDESIRRVRSLVAAVLDEAGVPRALLQSVGVAVPGVVDRATGSCVVSVQLGWSEVAVRAMLSDSLGLPVVVQNDVHAAALAEGRVGSAVGTPSFATLYVGHGVGAGIVLNGQLFYGGRGAAGEIGHSPVGDDGTLCSCGRRGCLETVAGGPAIIRAVTAALAVGEPSTLATLPVITKRLVAAAAASGDPLARRVVGDAGSHLGRSLAALLNTLDLDVAVVGGWIVAAGDAVLEPLRAATRAGALAGDRVAVIPSSLDERAETVGVVLSAMDLVGSPYRLVERTA